MEDSIQRLFSLVVASKLPGEQASTFLSPTLKLSISRQKASEIGNKTIRDATGEITMPGWCDLKTNDEDCNPDDAVDLKVRLDLPPLLCILRFQGKYEFAMFYFTSMSGKHPRIMPH